MQILLYLIDTQHQSAAAAAAAEISDSQSTEHATLRSLGQKK